MTEFYALRRYHEKRSYRFNWPLVLMFLGGIGFWLAVCLAAPKLWHVVVFVRAWWGK